MERTDDFETRREHLKGLTDGQLKERFWALCEKITEPLLEMGRVNTTPSIERSILLRMGFSSLEAGNIVNKCRDAGVLSKGAGHAVYKLARLKGIEIREAGLALEKGLYWDDLAAAFGKEGGGSN